MEASSFDDYNICHIDITHKIIQHDHIFLFPSEMLTQDNFLTASNFPFNFIISFL